MSRYDLPLPPHSSVACAINCALLLGALSLGAPMAKSQAHSPTPTPPANADAAKKFSGKVVETMDAAGYTYVLMDTGKEKLWVAAPKFVVKLGDSISVADTLPMSHFRSQTLNRDFEMVYFTGKVNLNGNASPIEEKSTELPKNHPPIKGIPGKPTLSLSDIKKADGGKSIAEIFADMAQLKGKSVKVRGKVVKYN